MKSDIQCKQFLIDMITDKHCERCHHYNDHSDGKTVPVTGCHQCWMIVVSDTEYYTKENSIVSVSCCLYVRSLKWKHQVIKRFLVLSLILTCYWLRAFKRDSQHWHASWSLIAMDVSLGGDIFYASSLHSYDLKELMYSVIAPNALWGKWLIFYFC